MKKITSTFLYEANKKNIPGSTETNANHLSKEAAQKYLSTGARIFISYRHQDSQDAVLYLRALLSKKFGKDKIFHDQHSIDLGADFPAIINTAIAAASVLILVIGKTWHSITGRDGKPRLKDRKDYVRIEIESAFRFGVTIIPVLLDGAEIPDKKYLPPSISKISTLLGVKLSWLEGITGLGKQIEKIEKNIITKKAAAAERAKKINLASSKKNRATIKASPAGNIIITAMELSLNAQRKHVLLDKKELYSSLKKHVKTFNKDLYTFQDVIFIIDIYGVKDSRSDDRYVARSFPLKSIMELNLHLTLKRPVITGFTVYEKWFDKDVSKTGLIDFDEPRGPIQGGTTGVIVGLNPNNGSIKLLTPWPTWGKNGVATLSQSAAAFHLDKTMMRSIEVVKRPAPLLGSK